MEQCTADHCWSPAWTLPLAGGTFVELMNRPVAERRWPGGVLQADQDAAGQLTDAGWGPRCTHPYVSVTKASPSVQALRTRVAYALMSMALLSLWIWISDATNCTIKEKETSAQTTKPACWLRWQTERIPLDDNPKNKRAARSKTNLCEFSGWYFWQSTWQIKIWLRQTFVRNSAHCNLLVYA